MDSGNGDARSGSNDGSPLKLDGPAAQDAPAMEVGPPPAGNPAVYVGTGFTGSQIKVFQLDIQSGALAAKTPATSAAAPTYLAFHPTRRYVYALSEADPGRIVAFAADGAGLLTRINDAASGGNGPAHLSVHGSGKWLLVANYNSGHVAVLPIQPNGGVGAPVDVQHPANEQVHHIVSDPMGTFVFVCATGPDRIFQYRLDEATGKLTPNTPAFVSGGGQSPRHMAFHPNGASAYVVGESGGSVTAFDYDGATGRLSNPMVTRVGNDGSHIAVHPSGKFVYVASRGASSLVVFAVEAGGRLRQIEQVQNGLAGPWDFAIEPTGKFILVANDGNSSVRVFRVNEQTGMLTPAGTPLSSPTPHFVGVMYPPQ
jgi:6-phosphogluconolactonase